MSADGKPPPDGSCPDCTGADGLHALGCPSHLLPAPTMRETAAVADMERTNRAGMPMSYVRLHESEGCKRRRAENTALRRKVARVQSMGVDEFMGTLSTLAGLTPREHHILFSWLHKLAKNERPTYAALGRQFHCTRAAIQKSHRKAKAKIDAALGHELKPPQYDGLDRYDDLVIIFDSRLVRQYTTGKDDGDESAVRAAEQALRCDPEPSGEDSGVEGIHRP